ncbi:hypothetical protein [Methylocapsa sp. S129]|uniref:hypothetical protein n=1 Tax=Methylocapsa sp. S129 TaxID=1641869 RepID=UPI001AEDF4C4|nr:hypothetical protein [Methylocapsa sp. S129]
MMPSRAFCSDESQGYPVILLMQHFGTFPFDHGRVGGKVATNRHGPHAHHGEDLVIIQASHVGYDPASGRFGVYQRQRTADCGFGDNCGKLCAVLHWYQKEYDYACRNILCGAIENKSAVYVDNHLLTPDRPEGLFLRLDRLIAGDLDEPLKILSTSKAFSAAPDLVARLPTDVWKQGRTPIGARLAADMFFFRRTPIEGPEGHDLLEAALAPVMPALVTSPNPALDAARYHTQVEFDRTYRSIQSAPEYRGKNLLFLAGLNIDVSPPEGMPFPLTKFVPWAAYFQPRNGAATLLEQDALVDALMRQSTSNADQISFDAAIRVMAEAEGVTLPL